MREKDSYRDMKRKLKMLSHSYPEHMQVFCLAKTADGSNIYVIRLGNAQAAKHILLQGAMHAREWLNTELLLYMVKKCCQGYDHTAYQGAAYRELFERVCVWVVPMLNPDGVAVSQKGIDGLRSERLQRVVWEAAGKRTKTWKANGRGVDLNRNYSPGFSSAAAFDRGSENYAGKCPFSERETRAIVKLIHMIKPCAVVNYHETGRLIYYRNKSRLTQTVHAQTGYRLVKETQEDNGNLGDWLTAQQIDWCTVETCVGKAPVSRLQLLTEYRRHDTLIPAIAGIYAEHSFLSTAGRKSQV